MLVDGGDHPSFRHRPPVYSKPVEQQQCTRLRALMTSACRILATPANRAPPAPNSQRPRRLATMLSLNSSFTTKWDDACRVVDHGYSDILEQRKGQPVRPRVLDFLGPRVVDLRRRRAIDGVMMKSQGSLPASHGGHLADIKISSTRRLLDGVAMPVPHRSPEPARPRYRRETVDFCTEEHPHTRRRRTGPIF